MQTDRILPFAGVLWFGAMAGFFWSFSAVVMPGLDRADPAVAITAMQDINVAVRNPLFGVGFFGAALIAAALVVRSAFMARFAGAVNAAAALVYLAGVLGTTALGNVPLNEALAAVDPTAGSAAAAMADYLRDWTDLNHVRTAAALVATAMLLWSFGQGKRTGA